MEGKSLFGKRNTKLPVRNSNTNRRSRSLSRNTLTVNPPGSTRARSISQTPSSAFRSRSTEINRQKKKDTRPVSDKQWQAKQTAKLQNYLINIGRDDLLINRTSIRPLSLNNFVEIMNTLLEPLMGKDKLSMMNYVERIPTLLSMIKYPGPCTASVLKSANTLCSWPQVVAIMSWSMQLHEWWIMDLGELGEIEKETIEDKINDLKKKACLDAYVIFNMKMDSTVIQNKFDEDLQNLLELPDDMEEYLHATQEEIDRRRRKCMEEDEENQRNFDEVKSNLDRLTMDRLSMEANVKDKKKNIKLQEQQKDENQREIESLDEEIKKLEAELKVLEKEGVKPCTPEESQQLKSEIAQLKSEVESVDETVKYKQDVMDNYEIKCSQLHATLNDKVKQFNLALIEPSITNTKLESVQIPSDFLRTKDIQLLDEKFALLQEFHRKLIKDSEGYLQEINLQKMNIEKVKKRIELGDQAFDQSRNLNVAKQNQIEDYKIYMKKEIEKMENKIKATEQELNNYKKKIPNVDELNTVLKNLQEKIKNAEKKFLGTKRKMSDYSKSLIKINNSKDLDHITKSMNEINLKLITEFKKIEEITKKTSF